MCHSLLPDSSQAHSRGQEWIGRLLEPKRFTTQSMVDAAFARTNAYSTNPAIADMVGTIIDKKLDKARAPTTLATYQSGWSSNLEICKTYGMAVYPDTESKLIAYAALAHEKKGILAETIRNYLSAIAFAHRMHGLDDPRQNSSLLKLVIDGCRREDRESGRVKKLRLGISGSMLETIVSSLDRSDFRAARWAAWATCSYFGGFRANELVKNDKLGVTCLWNHFNLFQKNSNINYFLLSKRFLKNMQFGPGIDIPICKTGTAACPFHSMNIYRSFFAHQTNLDTCPAFMDLDHKPYTYRQALSDTRFYLNLFGYDGASFGTHSFRIGMATEAGRLELPEWIVKLLGRWNSECYKIYIRTDPALLASFAQKLRGR